MGLHRSPSSEGAAATTSVHERLATTISTRVHEVNHGTSTTIVDEKGQNGRSPGQPAKTRPRPPRSQQANGRTHGKRLDPPHTLEYRLVACHEGLGGRIHQRLRLVPTEQKHQQEITNPPLQNHGPTARPTIRGRIDGPDHSATQESRVRCHSHDRRSWVHTRRTIYPMHHQRDWRRHRAIVPGQRVSVVRITLQSHL